MISFNTIPAALRLPGTYIEFDGARTVSGLPPQPNAALLIGQRLATGAVVAGVPTRIASAADAVAAFGRGSMLAAMAASFRAGDQTSDLFAIALDDAAGSAAATQQLTVTGSPTTGGTVWLMVAGRAVSVGAVAGAAAADIAQAIRDAVNAAPDLPVTATVNAGVVTLTSRHKGVVGNDIELRLNYYQGQALPAGLAIALANTPTLTANPDIAPALAAMGDTPYRTLVLGCADTATLAKVEAELVDRWGPQRMVEAMAYGAVRGTQGGLATFGNGRNSPFVTVIGMRSAPNPTWEWAAAYAAAVGFNSAIDPARPFQTLALAGIVPPIAVDRFTRLERDLLLHDGISTYTVDAGGVVRIERAVTMYQTGALGLPDLSWLDVNTPLTLAYLRLAVRSRIGLKYRTLTVVERPVGGGGTEPTRRTVATAAWSRVEEPELLLTRAPPTRPPLSTVNATEATPLPPPGRFSLAA